MENKEFWDGAEPLQLGRMPRLQVPNLIGSSLKKKLFKNSKHFDFRFLKVPYEKMNCVLYLDIFHKSLPNKQDSVTVVGYPLGGDTISVTKGVVSRIEVCSALIELRQSTLAVTGTDVFVLTNLELDRYHNVHNISCFSYS